MKHLSFIGMMGSGKTTVAKIASESSGMPFIDLDQKVEDTAEMNIPEIFSQHGEARFRELESQALKEVMAESEPSVVATGGGVILNKANRQLLKKHSVVVWLSVAPEELAKRIEISRENQNEPKRYRPLLMDDEDISKAINRLYKNRLKFYKETADLALGGELMGAVKLAEKSLDQYKLEIQQCKKHGNERNIAMKEVKR